jgi:tetratricopeptide (TPR) repeat protein
MIVDPRHDHSMRIPRPDRSVALGTPNACSGCHADRTAQWAADAVRRWYPQPRSGFQTFAEAFDAAERGAPGARAMLIAIAKERAQPGIVRASALARLEDELSETSAGTVVTALGDSDALVRLAAVEALARTNLEMRPRWLSPMLRDPARTVRMAAARGLAGPVERQMSAEVKASFDAALAEYLAAEQFVADRPEAHINIGTLALVRGRLDDAEASFRKALAIDPSFAPAAVSLADLKRNQGMEADGERVLRSVLQINPDAAVARHALGLSLVRQKRMQEAVVALDAAARSAPENARFSYAYGLALHDTGRRPEAIKVLTSALARHPFDRDILYALATYEIAAGRRDQARNHARLLRELAPDNTDYARLTTMLR